MARGGAFSSSVSQSFRMPSEPCPVPSIGSDDEESFVVLGKSITSDYEESPSEVNNYPIGASLVPEGKQLISSELSQMENATSSSVVTDITQNQKKSIVVQNDSIDASIIQEAKHLINRELSQIESLSSSVSSDITQIKNNSLEFKRDSSENEVSQLDQSTALPVMPDVQTNFHNDPVNNTISIASFSVNDLTSQEVQNKVAQIIEENIHLKDTLLQNNMSMKSQYERIVAWQEDVQKVHQAHKEKFLEAKEFIERLKKEIFTLKQELDKLKEARMQQDEVIVSLKNALLARETVTSEKLVKTADENMKEFELDIASKKLKELQLSLENLTLENKNLTEEKEKLNLANEKIRELEITLENLTKKSASSDRVQDESHSKVFEAQNHVKELEQEVQRLKEIVEQAHVELIKVKSVELEKQKVLIDQVNNLRSELYLVQQRPPMAMPPSTEELNYLRQQLMNSQIALTQCEESRSGACAQIDALNHKICELTAQLSNVHMQNDDMFALQTQLEVYKADFEAERAAKETMRLEKDKIAEDLQQLHRRNQQLQEEIELIRERDYVHVGRPPYSPRRPASSSSSASSATGNNVMKCPKCGFGFNTLQSLENHVYRCIDLDDSLP